MYCPKCGTRNDDNARQCTRCRKVISLMRVQKPQETANLQDMGMPLPVESSWLATASGYAGIFAFLCFPAFLAVILGILALNDIRQHPYKRGKDRAVLGLITGAFWSIVWVALTFIVLAVKY